MAICAALPLLLASCEASEAEMNNAEAEGNFVFRLSLPPALSVDTRAGDINNTSIDNVWVMQFDKDDLLIAAKHFGESSIKQATDADGNENKALLIVTTDGFSDVNSTFRVLGNFGSDQQNLVNISQTSKAPKTRLQSTTIAYSSYNSPTNFLVSDDIEYKSKNDPNVEKAIIIAPLNFAYAKVDVKWTNKVASSAKFILNSIKAYNLPQTLAIDTRAGAASGVYPSSATASCDVEAPKNGNISAGGTYTFYMPENLRGMGCGMSFQDKNLTLYAPKPDGTAPTLDADGKPGAGGTLANCTYIDLEGTYQYGNSDGIGPVSGAVAVRYRLYLGGNLMNDYNIRRGYHYTITVEVSGINSGDVRVTITDGAVVVFDKVDTITKEVNFR